MIGEYSTPRWRPAEGIFFDESQLRCRPEIDNHICYADLKIFLHLSDTTVSDQTMDVEPEVIQHPPEDHRHVHPEEVKKVGAYNVIMNRPHTTIRDYAMTSKSFLKPTSSWSELHIIAFRCLILEHLPISRVLPHSELPSDDDKTMKLVLQHLSASEEDIRSGRCLEGLGPATIFYQQLQVVLRRPGTPPDPIPIPRVLRESSRRAVFPSIPESDTTMSTDSSYQPSPEVRVVPPGRPRTSMDITGQPPSERASPDILPRRASIETQRTNSSVSSGASALDEDKLEMCANQVVVSLLGLLCTFEQISQSSTSKRLSFRLSFLSILC